jgi:L-amino acid N-acyltransferase YncA
MATLRPVTLADVPAITAIYGHEVRHGTASWEYEPPDEEEMRRRVTGLLAAGYPYLVAEVDGALAGYSYAGPFRTRAGYRYVVEDSIYVAPGWQRRGIARLLLTAVIEEATRRGFRQMVAVIGDSRNEGSIALHRALGFAHIATFPAIGLKFGRWLDSVQMQRALGEGSATIPAAPGP